MSGDARDTPLMRILLAITFGVPVVVVGLLVWWWLS